MQRVALGRLSQARKILKSNPGEARQPGELGAGYVRTDHR